MKEAPLGVSLPFQSRIEFTAARSDINTNGTTLGCRDSHRGSCTGTNVSLTNRSYNGCGGQRIVVDFSSSSSSGCLPLSKVDHRQQETVLVQVVHEWLTIFLRFCPICSSPVLSSSQNILDGSQNIGSIGNALKRSAAFYLEGVECGMAPHVQRHVIRTMDTCLEGVLIRAILDQMDFKISFFLTVNSHSQQQNRPNIGRDDWEECNNQGKMQMQE